MFWFAVLFCLLVGRRNIVTCVDPGAMSLACEYLNNYSYLNLEPSIM